MEKKKRILLVDDSKTQLIRLKMSFEKNAYEVLTASDGLEGVSRAVVDKPDIVVSDIMMPELNGYQLCRLLKNDKKTAHIPIILLTSLDQRQDRFWGIRAGADQYIVKDTNLSSLEAAIEQLLKNPIAHPDGDEGNVPVSSTSSEWTSIKSNVNRLLDKLLFESTLSSEARQLANFINDKDDLLKEFKDLVSSLIDYSCLCLCLHDGKRTMLYFDLKQPMSESEISKVKKYLVTKIDSEFTKEGIETAFFKESAGIDDTAMETIVARLLVPLTIHSECIGHLSFLSTKQNAFSPKIENIINLLAHDFSMVFKLMLLYDQTRELSITDGLTKLFNKRYFLEIFEKEFERAKRFKNDLCLIVLDIDHFKSVNDTYGHLQGDSVLKEIGDIINDSIRKIDIPARYGGEEFVIIAPNTNIQDILTIAERIRGSTESHEFQAENQPLKITVSIGVSALNGMTRDKLELIKKADEALYKAKHSGRNRICLADESMP